MTVGIKLQQTIASAEFVLANLKTFSLETQDQAAKQMFHSLAKSQQMIIETLNSRLQFIQKEEPEYKTN
ncbi:MAG: DUF1657 domain-containing protein [Thermoactinomyces sp.]|jgi:hypothetical protein